MTKQDLDSLHTVSDRLDKLEKAQDERWQKAASEHAGRTPAGSLGDGGAGVKVIAAEV